MINSNEILEMLKSGKSVDDIASEYSKALNEAVKAKEEEDKKAKIDSKKLEDANLILDMIDEFIVNYYPKYKDAFTEVSGEELIEAVDSMIEIVDEVSNMVGGLKIREKSKGKKAVDTDAVFADFFKKYGI